VLFVYNLRFPGQYYDQESKLHYNYFRSYDPSTGRYVEADPIGLLGDDNTFVYASTPTMWVDPLGLWKGQPRNNGRFGHGKDPNKPTKPQSTGHGNSNDNPNCTTLYKLVNPDGTVSKWGITSEANPFDRYSRPQYGDRKMVPIATGSRIDMKALERVLVQRFGGKENLESWANTIKNSGSPEQTIAAFKAAKRGCIKIL
jgi:RHS repeat-associated protein